MAPAGRAPPTGTACARSGRGAAASAPTRRRPAARACPRSRSRSPGGPGRGPGRRGAALRTSAASRPRRAPASASARRPHGRGPRSTANLRSTKLAIARQRRVEALTGDDDGQRRLGADHAPTSRPSSPRGCRSARRGRPPRGRTAGRRALSGPAPRRRTPPIAVARPRRTRRPARPGATGTSPRARRASRAVPALVGGADRGDRRPREPSCSASVGRAAWCSTMPSTSRWPETANSRRGGSGAAAGGRAEKRIP
jgi:hypothetical protein